MCLYVCSLCMYASECICITVYACLCEWPLICMHVCMCLYMYEWMHEIYCMHRTNECMNIHVCMYVCMYDYILLVCIYLSMHVFIYAYLLHMYTFGYLRCYTCIFSSTFYSLCNMTKILEMIALTSIHYLRHNFVFCVSFNIKFAILNYI